MKKAKLKKKKQELGAPDPGGDVVAASDVALEAPPVAAGDIAPDFVLRGAHGGERRLADLIAAGPALLVFFKTTCKASKIALPLYGELDRRYGDVVPVLAIAQDPVEVAQPWLADQRFAGPVLADLPTYEVSASYGLLALPTAVLINRDRTVMEALVGWSRDAMNALAVRIGRLTARDERPVSLPADGRVAFRPG